MYLQLMFSGNQRYHWPAERGSLTYPTVQAALTLAFLRPRIQDPRIQDA